MIRRLFADIETSPNVCLSWRVGRKITLDSDNILTERRIICIGYKWAGDKDAKSLVWDANQDDKAMLEKFIPIANRADEIVAHNGDRFDIPWIKTRAIYHGLPPFPHWKTVDTLQWCRRRLYFNSNRLDYIGKFLGIGGKLKTEFNLWKDVVLDHSSAALRTMAEYCRRDVELLEKVWERIEFAGCVKTHAGVLVNSEKWTCAHCASQKVIKSKTLVTARGTVQHQMRCHACHKYFTISEPAYEAYRAFHKQAGG